MVLDYKNESSFPGSSIGSSGWLLTTRLQVRVLPGEPANKRPVLFSMGLLFANFADCRTRSEDSADRIGRKSLTNVLRQESEGEVTQGETVSFDRSDRVLPGEPFRRA